MNETARAVSDAIAHLQVAIDLDPRMDPVTRALIETAIARLESTVASVT